MCCVNHRWGTDRGASGKPSLREEHGANGLQSGCHGCLHAGEASSFLVLPLGILCKRF